MEWRQEKDMPVFMYIFLNKIDDAEEARWTEKEKNEGYKTYKKLLELTEDDSSDVIKKCLRIIKETRHIVEYELWNKIVYFMTDYINGETVWAWIITRLDNVVVSWKKFSIFLFSFLHLSAKIYNFPLEKALDRKGGCL